ncbi:MAG: molecular chaperone [Bacteroidales bacterium]|nr:molecular chaperone [Bacteroidales bacterium]
MRIFRNISIFLALSFLTGVFTPSFGQGNLLVTPRRVVFDGSRRVMELNLANTGQEPARYNISFVQYRMTEDGAFEEITEPDPGQFFADKHLRFFPRTILLGPNEAQTVRMQVLGRERLEPGEYRSHVYFRAVPDELALGEVDPDADTTAVSIRLIPIFGITIPVIIRVGENTTEVTLSDLGLTKDEEGRTRLGFTFNRTGNMSVYGDITVTHVAPNGIETQVGVVNGIAVYTPNTLRKFQLQLAELEEIDYSSGKLLITYTAQSDVRPQTYATAQLNLP